MTEKEKISVLYHSIFNYSLSTSELKKWRAGHKLKIIKNHKLPSKKYLRDQKANDQKMLIAKRSGEILQKIPTILFVGITGSLAMNNVKKESDIDLMIITRANSLWLTRIISFVCLTLSGFTLRRANIKDEKNKLCLNFWIDETVLPWTGPKNAYTAHEIAQVIPLVNKENVYEKWILKNNWTNDYWPNATSNIKIQGDKHSSNILIRQLLVIINIVLFKCEYLYMKSKLTREQVSLHTAFFHPYDWGNKTLSQLKKVGILSL